MTKLRNSAGNMGRSARLKMASSVLALALAFDASVAMAKPAEVDVDAGMAAQSLVELGRQSGVSIVFSYENLKGVRTSAVSGNLEPLVALRRMLRGTGFEVVQTSEMTYAVRPAANRTPNRTSASYAPPQSESSSQQEAPTQTAEPGVIRGVVTSEDTGTALRGAIVTIAETGNSVVTDRLGEYRFSGLPAGTYTLNFSYLGLLSQDVRVRISDTAGSRYSLAMSSPSDIVVYGYRSARSQALNQEKTRDNVSTTLTADQLGNFNGTTLSESLRRVGGVTFDLDPLTGDGTNVFIRGLSPDLNTVTFNGIELPDDSGRGRGVDLGGILTNSINQVTISKTLTASQDGSGVGGVVDITTATPFDRPRRFFSALVEGSKTPGSDFQGSYVVGGTASMLFGQDDRFGASFSAQYRESDLERVLSRTSLVYGWYLPLAADGSTSIRSPLNIDPALSFPFEPDTPNGDIVYPRSVSVSRGETRTTNLTLTGSLSAKLGDHTTLFADYTRLERKDDSWLANSSVLASFLGADFRVPSLGGEVRRVPNLFVSTIRTLATGNEVSDDSSTDILAFRGETDLDRWQFRYSLGYAAGESETRTQTLQTRFRSLSYAADLFLPEATDPLENRIISPWGRFSPGTNALPQPLLTEAGFNRAFDIANYPIDFINDNITVGENSRYNAAFSANYTVDRGIIDTIETGVSYERSRFADYDSRFDRYISIRFIPLSEIGLTFDRRALDEIGLDFAIPHLERTSVESYLDSIVTGQDTSDDRLFGYDLVNNLGDELLQEEFTREEDLSAYIQTRLEFGDFDANIGLRMTRVRVSANTVRGPRLFLANGVEDTAFRTANQGLAAEAQTQTDFMPRALVNYRPQDNIVVRAGYYSTVSRPRIESLTQTPFILLRLVEDSGPNDDQALLIVSKGNPGLRPAITHNFDTSFEWYDDNIGVFKLGAFYKLITNPLENGAISDSAAAEDVRAILPDNQFFNDAINNIGTTAGTVFLDATQPFNNPDNAHIWGIETSLERQFTFLPGALAGLGVFANYTYTDSSKRALYDYRDPLTNEVEQRGIDGRPFALSARHSGTVGLTYSRSGFDGNILYTRQSRRLEADRPNGLSLYQEPYGTLDARIEYNFAVGPADAQLYLVGTNLLQSYRDATLELSEGDNLGVSDRYFVGQNYLGGRRLQAGLRVTF